MPRLQDPVQWEESIDSIDQWEESIDSIDQWEESIDRIPGGWEWQLSNGRE